LLKIVEVDYKKGLKKIFKKLNLRVSAGEFCYLLYSDSREKEFLLGLVYNQNRLKNGSVMIMGQDINRMSEKEFALLRKKTSIVYGDFKLISSKSVYGNLSYALDLSVGKNSLSEEKLDRVLDFFGLLHKKHDYPESLDNREKQLLAIVRAVVRGSDLFILEDPTKFLTKDDCEKLMLFLEKLNKRGKTIFFITEDAPLIAEHQHRVLKLEKGAIYD